MKWFIVLLSILTIGYNNVFGQKSDTLSIDFLLPAEQLIHDKAIVSDYLKISKTNADSFYNIVIQTLTSQEYSNSLKRVLIDSTFSNIDSIPNILVEFLVDSFDFYIERIKPYTYLDDAE